MKQLLFIIFLAIGVASCELIPKPDSEISSSTYIGIKKGDKFWVSAVCKGPKAGEIYAQSVERSMSASPGLIVLLQQGVCGKLPSRIPMPITKVIRALIDWEDDEAYLVQLANMQTNKPMDYYTIVWPQTKFEEPVNGSHNRRHTHQQDISTHLTPVKAGERVWIGGMCKMEEDAPLTLFLSAKMDMQDELQAHVLAGRCRSLGSLQSVLIAVVLTDGIDRQGNSYWLIQLANTKGEPQPWYSLAWENTLEANLLLPGGDYR